VTPDGFPSVCAIVVTYGDGQSVKRCVSSLRGSPDVSQIIVVNNKGDNAIDALCLQLGAEHIDPGANLGYGRGVNVGSRAVKASITHILVVNPDLVLVDLAPVLRALDRSGAAIATGCLRRKDGSVEPNTRRMASPTRELACAVIGTRAYGSLAPDLDDVAEPVEQAAGSLLLVKTGAWDNLMGFDERFELYYEDVDLCRRAGDQGGVVRIRTVVAEHFGGVSYRANRSQAYVALRVSRLRYLRKWYGVGGMALAFLLTFIEVITRGVTRQAEGWHPRIDAVFAQALEIKSPGRVAALSR